MPLTRPSSMTRPGPGVEHLVLRAVGTPRVGANNRRLARGDGEYVGDLDRADMHYLTVVRSPHAHARILSVDASEALAIEGVVDVILPTDVAEGTRPIPEGWDTAEAGARGVDWYALAQGRVRYLGEAVAAVVATDPYTARAAAGHVNAEYEILDAISSAEEALRPGAVKVEPSWEDNILVSDGFETGDFEVAIASAEHTAAGRVKSQRLTGVPIEPRGIVAEYDPIADLLTFWESTQQPHQVQTFLAASLGVREASIRVIQTDVGGAFGLKQPTSQEEVIVAFAARRLQKPVRWLESRSESFMVGGHARETECRYRVGFESDGNITALSVELVADVGAPTSYLGWGMSYVTMYSLPTVYEIDNVRVHLTSVVTNKCPWTPYRGFGKDIASFLMDRVVEKVARSLGIPSADVRRRNFIPSDAFPYSQASGAMLDSGAYEQVLDTALESIGYSEFRRMQAAARAEGRYIGLGIGQELTPEGVAMPGSITNNGYDGATVRVMPTGEVMVLTGVTSPGNGNETALAQIAADTLACDIDLVTVVQGDTESCPWGLGNYSSRSIIIGGSAVFEAGRELRQRMHKVAASMLATEPENLAAADGRIWVVEEPARSVEFSEVVERVYWHAFEEHADLVEPGLEATRYFRISNIYHQPERDGRFSVYPTWPNGMAACIVEVDPDTGGVRILRYCMVEDAGTVINPLLADATMHGGIAQGLGSVLYEQVSYDDNGQLITATLMDYTIPTAVELPRFDVRHQHTPSPFTPLGAKGVGESGLGAALGAVCNAIEDAFPHLEVWFEELPLSPARVWNAIRAARARSEEEERR